MSRFISNSKKVALGFYFIFMVSYTQAADIKSNFEEERQVYQSLSLDLNIDYNNNDSNLFLMLKASQNGYFQFLTSIGEHKYPGDAIFKEIDDEESQIEYRKLTLAYILSLYFPARINPELQTTKSNVPNADIIEHRFQGNFLKSDDLTETDSRFIEDKQNDQK